MLDNDKGMTCLFEDGHQLECCKCPADLQICELAVELAEDAGVVAADVEDLEPLEVEVLVQGLDEHLSGSL